MLQCAFRVYFLFSHSAQRSHINPNTFSSQGKYCLHFHKLRSCPDCQFADNAIEQSHQRGIIVHGTHLSTISNNVLWDVRGAGIYIEDGNEMFNRIKYNVIVCPFPFMDQIMHGKLRFVGYFSLEHGLDRPLSSSSVFARS